MALPLHTEPGDEPIEVRDGPLRVRKRSVSETDNNVYLLACAASGRSLLVDAADDAPRIRALATGTVPLAVVQTHGHWDHVRAWSALAADPGLEIWGHQGDVGLYPAAPDRLLCDGQILTVGELDVEVLHVPGHTPGSLLLLVHGSERPWLITGDSLFPGGPGNTSGDLTAHALLMDGLEDRVFGRLPDETLILPGHGDASTLGRERPHLPSWRERGW